MSDSLLPHGPPVYCCCCWVTKLCPTLCNPLNCSMPGFPTLHYLLEFAQIHVLWVCDGIQPCHPLSPSSFVFSLSQHQRLFKWVSSSHQVCMLCLILNQDMSSFWSLLLGTTNEDRKELNFPFPSCLRISTEDVLDDSSCEATITLFSPVSFAHNIKCRKRNGLSHSI